VTRILVFGKNGQLATALAEANTDANLHLKFISSNEFNLISQISDIYDYIYNFLSIDGVINASAYTDVDKAEIQCPEDSWVLNALVPEQMAMVCNIRNIPFFHVSTESVFDGKSSLAYVPISEVNPANFYGLTKLEGEQLVRAVKGKGAIFRTSWVFSHTGQNFVKAMLSVAKKNKVIQVVDDQIGLPTYAPDLAIALLTAVRNFLGNSSEKFDPVYHIAGGGEPINRYDFAKLIIQLSDLETKVEPISSMQFAAIAPRPKNAVLDTDSFTSTFSVDLPNWQNGLKHMLLKAG
jgi:dTDP-4-dehydrorhamnose reductase